MNKKKEILYLVLELLGALVVIGGVIGLGAYLTYPINSFLCAAIIFLGLFLLAIVSFYIVRSWSRLSYRKEKENEYSLYEFEASESKFKDKLKDYKLTECKLRENEYEIYTSSEKPSLTISYIIIKTAKEWDVSYISNDIKNLVDRYELGLTNVIFKVDEYKENFINSREMTLRGILFTYVDKKNMCHLNVNDKTESYEYTERLIIDLHNKIEERR